MLTVECKVNIDWIEDGSVDEILQEAIVAQAVNKISSSISEQVGNMAAEILDKRVNGMIDNIWENFIEKRVNLTDKYGDVVESHDSIKDMLKARLDNFINQQVDKDGHVQPAGKCGYNTKRRLDWMMDKIVSDRATSFMKEVEASFNQKLKDTLSAKMRETLSSALVKNIDINGLIAQANG